MIIELLIAAAALGGGYGWTKSFVRRRLRFVDVVHTRPAPWIAGGVAALVATPVTLLPLITGVTAVALGLGVGLGVRSAQRDRLLPPGD
jgi:cytochrome c oxidase assembly factor CtaG